MYTLTLRQVSLGQIRSVYLELGLLEPDPTWEAGRLALGSLEEPGHLWVPFRTWTVSPQTEHL